MRSDKTASTTNEAANKVLSGAQRMTQVEQDIEWVRSHLEALLEMIDRQGKEIAALRAALLNLLPAFGAGSAYEMADIARRAFVQLEITN